MQNKCYVLVVEDPDAEHSKFTVLFTSTQRTQDNLKYNVKRSTGGKGWTERELGYSLGLGQENLTAGRWRKTSPHMGRSDLGKEKESYSKNKKDNPHGKNYPSGGVRVATPTAEEGWKKKKQSK